MSVLFFLNLFLQDHNLKWKNVERMEVNHDVVWFDLNVEIELRNANAVYTVQSWLNGKKVSRFSLYSDVVCDDMAVLRLLQNVEATQENLFLTINDLKKEKFDQSSSQSPLGPSKTLGVLKLK